MKNIDITEWLSDNSIDSETEIVVDGKKLFLADVLEKHLKEQLTTFANWLQEKAWEDQEKDFEDFIDEYYE
jgi:hypothetical protein